MLLLLASGVRDGIAGGGEPLRLAMLGGLAGFTRQPTAPAEQALAPATAPAPAE